MTVTSKKSAEDPDRSGGRRTSELTLKHRLPAVFDAREYVEAGGLMSYGPNIDAIYRRLAVYADRLLQAPHLSSHSLGRVRATSLAAAGFTLAVKEL